MSETVISYTDLLLKPGRQPLNGKVVAGEIVGLAGLEGQGQDAFLHVLAGLLPPRGGTAWIGEAGGTPIRNNPQTARHGIAYLPRDRRTTGIFPVLSVLDNFGLPSMGTNAVLGVLNRGKQRSAFKRFAEFLSIRYPHENAPITALSGGNQQKVLLARWLALEPRVLLLNDPTRGVDLATRLKFYETFRDLAAKQGKALVILSSEIEEILQICDRVMVFRDFELHSTLDRAAMSMDSVLAAMFGQGGAQ